MPIGCASQTLRFLRPQPAIVKCHPKVVQNMLLPNQCNRATNLVLPQFTIGWPSGGSTLVPNSPRKLPAGL